MTGIQLISLQLQNRTVTYQSCSKWDRTWRFAYHFDSISVYNN